MASATVIPTTTTAFLLPGTKVEFQGTEYLILKPNRVNYQVINRAGKRFNLSRYATMVSLGEDAAWYKEATTVSATETQFKSGDPIRVTGIKKGANTKFNGMEGLVAKVNPRNYSVVLKGFGMITVSGNLLVSAE